MTAPAAPAAPAVTPAAGLVIEPRNPADRFWFGLRDFYTMTRRYVLRARRQSDVIFGSLLSPIIFVVLFGYVFGSAITVPGGHYRAYLLSGLFAQTTLFASSTVAVAVATDMSEGVIDRMRTMPVARSAVLMGRAVSNSIIGLPALAVMISCALIVGWRAEAGLGRAVLGFLLLAVFGFAMAWVGIWLGMVARSPQSADVLSMLPSFLLGFISNVFVPTEGMPAWLRVVAQWNPLSAVVAAARQLFGTTQGGPVPHVWSLQHPVPTTLIMTVLLLAVFVPLSVRLYTRRTR
jgi:ABC-2 type transport system permease protein